MSEFQQNFQDKSHRVFVRSIAWIVTFREKEADVDEVLP